MDFVVEKREFRTHLDGERRHQCANGGNEHTNQTRIFATDFLRQQSTGYMRYDVAPVERRQNQSLQTLRPIEPLDGRYRMHGNRLLSLIDAQFVFERRTDV